MSFITQTLKALKSAADIRSKGVNEPVRIWSLTEDEDDLSRIQRELAKQSLTARALR